VEKILTKDEEYGTPVTFTISFTNKGNIESAPSVKIEIIKGGEGIIDTIEKTMEKIKPGESKDYKIEWPTKGKEQGVYYRGTVTVSLDGEVLEKKEGIGFRILEKGSLKGKDGSSSVLVGIMIILIILAAGVAAYYAITRYKE
ncbi:hypothetical protein KY358_04130, partial [Candidatus Woesearchaeota archaeon]|nr:hypothetical protein [Candidatus Woesearchaeota archaeon]